MPPIILPHQRLGSDENNIPDSSPRELAGFAITVVMNGLKPFGVLAAALTTVIGGCGLGYLVLFQSLSLAWALVAFLTLVIVLGTLGAFAAWRNAYRAALRFWPTWEQAQRRADTLRAFVEVYGDEPDFKQRYVSAHMVPARHDFDRVLKAGYSPCFDYDQILTADTAQVRELIEALDAVVAEWRQDNTTGLFRSAKALSVDRPLQHRGPAQP